MTYTIAVTSHGRNGSHLPPPHRSVREELPRTALTLGFNVEAGYGVRIHS